MIGDRSHNYNTPKNALGGTMPWMGQETYTQGAVIVLNVALSITWQPIVAITRGIWNAIGRMIADIRRDIDRGYIGIRENHTGKKDIDFRRDNDFRFQVESTLF